MKIERAAEADVPALVALAAQLGYPIDPEQTRRQLREISRRDGHAVFVARDEGRACGWLHVQRQLLLELPEYAEITGLVVDETRRGTGLGSALVAAARDWAREQRLTALRVRCNVVRERAHAFYEREGFRLEKSQKVFRQELG